jgi:hypothetical protein
MCTKNHGQFVETLPLSKDEDISKVESKLSRILLNTRQSFFVHTTRQSFFVHNSVNIIFNMEQFIHIFKRKHICIDL